MIKEKKYSKYLSKIINRLTCFPLCWNWNSSIFQFSKVSYSLSYFLDLLNCDENPRIVICHIHYNCWSKYETFSRFSIISIRNIRDTSYVMKNVRNEASKWLDARESDDNFISSWQKYAHEPSIPNCKAHLLCAAFSFISFPSKLSHDLYVYFERRRIFFNAKHSRYLAEKILLRVETELFFKNPLCKNYREWIFSNRFERYLTPEIVSAIGKTINEISQNRAYESKIV